MWDEIYELISDEERLLALAPGANTSRTGGLQNDLARLDRAITQKEEAVTGRVAAALEAGVEPKVLARAADVLEEELTALRQQREALLKEVESATESKRPFQESASATLARVASTLMNPAPEVMEEVFRLLDVEVTILENVPPHPKLAVQGQGQRPSCRTIAARALDPGQRPRWRLVKTRVRLGRELRRAARTPSPPARP